MEILAVTAMATATEIAAVTETEIASVTETEVVGEIVIAMDVAIVIIAAMNATRCQLMTRPSRTAR